MNALAAGIVLSYVAHDNAIHDGRAFLPSTLRAFTPAAGTGRGAAGSITCRRATLCHARRARGFDNGVLLCSVCESDVRPMRIRVSQRCDTCQSITFSQLFDNHVGGTAYATTRQGHTLALTVGSLRQRFTRLTRWISSLTRRN